MRTLVFCASLAILAGCAGYRGGWESVPYVGDAPPARELALPGLKLAVQIDNRLRTYDTQVYLFVLPLSVDPREVYTQNHQPGKTRVFVSVTPEASGFVFEPTKATLTIGAQRFTGAEGFEFGKWDGKWEHRPVGAQFALHEPGRRYLLSIDFVAPAPSPESRDIVLDLSQALRSQAHPPLPLIRFAPVRWKEGYT